MKNGYLVAALSSKSITGILDVYGILLAIHKQKFHFVGFTLK
jgi:hypothetical protein